MFGCHRHRYFCGLAQNFEGRAVAAFGVLGGHGAQCSSEYPQARARNSNVDASDRYFACRKYEEEIEDDVK